MKIKHNMTKLKIENFRCCWNYKNERLKFEK